MTYDQIAYGGARNAYITILVKMEHIVGASLSGDVLVHCKCAHLDLVLRCFEGLT